MMTHGELPVQIGRIAAMERELAGARKQAAKSLRATRQALGLSLRAIRPKARRSIASLSDLETGKVWDTKVAERLAKAYAAKAAA